MQNIKAHIDRHNRAKLAPPKVVQEKTCNCIKSRRNNCPLNGECLQEAIVYQADVTPNNADLNNNNTSQPTAATTKTYYGNTARQFKKRFNEHQETIRNKNSKKHTALSRHCWQLKDKKIQHEIKWSIKARATPYTGGARWCDLCLSEKLAILMSNKETTLNSKNEIMGKCRHKRKFCLENVRR